jgi:hypothetical protein
MPDTNKYILERIHAHVWSGFDTPEDVHQTVDELLEAEGEPDADTSLLHAAVRTEFRKKAEQERTWPVTTDCDRLHDAFAELNKNGIIALHKTGMTMSDGHEDVGQALQERGFDGIKGYCFYHGQDLERAVNGDGLLLAFGDLDDTPEGKTAVARQIVSTLQRHGLSPDWNNDPEKRIQLPTLNWQRRLAP